MPLTMTYDQFVLEFGAYADEKAAGDNDAALIRLDNALAIRATLPDSISVDGGTAQLVNMAQLLSIKADLQADMVRASRRGLSRVIGAGVSHPSRHGGES